MTVQLNPFVESLPNNDGQIAYPIECSDNNTANVCDKTYVKGEHAQLNVMNSLLREEEIVMQQYVWCLTINHKRELGPISQTFQGFKRMCVSNSLMWLFLPQYMLIQPMSPPHGPVVASEQWFDVMEDVRDFDTWEWDVLMCQMWVEVSHLMEVLRLSNIWVREPLNLLSLNFGKRFCFQCHLCRCS